MTKSWTGVKNEACHLYLEGATLQQVEDRMKQKYGFAASKRAWRLKFKEWGVTRTSQLHKFKAATGLATDPSSSGTREQNFVQTLLPRLEVDTAMSEPSEPVIATPYSRSPVSTTAEAPYASLGVQHRLGVPELLSPSSASSSRQSPRAPLSRVEQLLVKLQDAKTGPGVFAALKDVDFVHERDSLLHLAITKAANWTVEVIIDEIIARNIDLDSITFEGCTPLEHAAQAGNRTAVGLLVAGGASLQRQNDAGEQPLHFAITRGASAEICELLLLLGADPNAPLRQKRQRHYTTPIYLAVELLKRPHLGSEEDVEKDRLCMIFDVLLRYGAEVATDTTNGKATTMSFLGTWLWLHPPGAFSGWSPSYRSFRLSHYLRAKFHPLCWFPKELCPGRECTTFAGYIFSHTPTSELPRLLIETTDVTKYGHDLLYAVLSPCTTQVTSSTDLRLHELVVMVLERLREQSVLRLPIQGILHYILRKSPEDQRSILLQIVNDWHLASAGEYKEALRGEELLRMSRVDQLRTAEILLSQPEAAPPELWNDLTGLFFSPAGVVLPNRVRAADESSTYALRERILFRLGLTRDEIGDAHVNCIVSCVLHCWTKKLFEGNSFSYPLAAQQRLYGASQIRQRYDLPPLPVSGDDILKMFPHMEQRYRGREPAAELPSNVTTSTEPVPESNHTSQGFSSLPLPEHPRDMSRRRRSLSGPGVPRSPRSPDPNVPGLCSTPRSPADARMTQ